MAIGKRELSAILLVFGAVFSVYMALLAGPISAQNAGDEGCDNPEEIETFSGTQDQTTPEFNITGTTFRLTWDIVEVTDPNGFPQLNVDVLDDSGQPIGAGFLAFEEDGSENILEGPGTFSLEIRADDVRYEIIVEDCVGINGENTNQNQDQFIDEQITVQEDEDLQEDVIIDKPRRREPTVINIPNKPLPPTGGLPVYGMVAGFVLAGASLLGLGVGIRRGQRR